MESKAVSSHGSTTIRSSPTSVSTLLILVAIAKAHQVVERRESLSEAGLVDKAFYPLKKQLVGQQAFPSSFSSFPSSSSVLLKYPPRKQVARCITANTNGFVLFPRGKQFEFLNYWSAWRSIVSKAGISGIEKMIKACAEIGFDRRASARHAFDAI